MQLQSLLLNVHSIMLSMAAPQSWTVPCDIYTQKVLVILIGNCYAASYKAALVITSNGFYSWFLDQKELSFPKWTVQITQRKASDSNVCLHSLLIFYSNPSLFFPHPLITFYLFPYFNTLLWQIVAVLASPNLS